MVKPKLVQNYSEVENAWQNGLENLWGESPQQYRIGPS
jgi:hypothetical protein